MPHENNQSLFLTSDRNNANKRHINLADFDIYSNNNTPRSNGMLSFLFSLLLLISGGLGYYCYFLYSQNTNLKDLLNRSELQIVYGIESKVREKVTTPEEKPTVSIVDKVDDYKNYTSYSDIKVGNFALKYEKSKKIIFYNSITNQVIAINDLISAPKSQISGVNESKKEITKVPIRILTVKSQSQNKNLIESLKAKLVNVAETIDILETKNETYKTLGVADLSGTNTAIVQKIISDIGAEEISLATGEKTDKTIPIYIIIGSGVK